MAKKPSALAGIFDDEPQAPAPEAALEARPAQAPAQLVASPKARRTVDAPASQRRSSHPGKKAVLIHIPEDMHRTLRQLSVEEGGEPLTVVTERLLRQYLVQRGHTRFAP
jgi:hypothetical protein